MTATTVGPASSCDGGLGDRRHRRRWKNIRRQWSENENLERGAVQKKLKMVNSTYAWMPSSNIFILGGGGAN